MNKSILSLAVAIGVAMTGMAHAGDIIPVNFDDPGEGYNDPAALAPAGGNPGTSVGEQRRIVAQFAADLWGTVLVSDVPVYVGAQFNPLAPNVLGSAGATFIFRDFDGAAFPGTWYSAALAESLTGEDLTEGEIDIISQFSSTFAFYYGLDGNTPAGQLSFLDVVMHEFGHGLGFQNFENEATGQFQSGFPDVYSQFTFDNSTGQFWPAMSVPQRQASAINYGNVVFTGANAKTGAALTLGPRTGFRVTAPAGVAGFYEYGTASFGALPTPANFSGTALIATDDSNAAGPSTTDGCTAFTNAGAIAGNIAIVDRGGCGFAVKAANAQAAGATGMIVANNAPGNPPPGMGGVDPTVTIPSISVTQSDGALLKANVPLTVGFAVDPSLLQGADNQGRPRLYMPNPVAPGSSGSHYDTALSPNALMEPAINDSLNAALFIDNSANLLKDTGWRLNTGTAQINGCNTEVKVITDAGVITGANVVATSNLIARTSANKDQYMARMETYRDGLLAAGLISGRQGGKIMSCAAKIGKAPK
ncbi:Serine protease [Lysobacter dokdonensis DS-58]|uniref:Serine protease n=1 Tax=Lysobacter dokdonensis DS-58 TaxID=1300345 RepID=A0A0A2X1M9_9GAMM|nr:PA domain-containing protein [Lysobacter dokdonensis]KGQ19099.1 Serine protease [Lysobacter dokdonensis DS-58]